MFQSDVYHIHIYKTFTYLPKKNNRFLARSPSAGVASVCKNKEAYVCSTCCAPSFYICSILLYDTCLRIVVEQLRGERGVAVDEKTRPDE